MNKPLDEPLVPSETLAELVEEIMLGENGLLVAAPPEVWHAARCRLEARLERAARRRLEAERAPAVDT